MAMRQERASFLAILAFSLGFVAFITCATYWLTPRSMREKIADAILEEPATNWLTSRSMPDVLFLGSMALASAAIILAHISRLRIRRSDAGARGEGLALGALAFGYGWFALVFFAGNFAFEVFVIVGLIEAPHLLLRFYPKHLWAAPISALVLSTSVWCCYRSVGPVSLVIGVIGLVTMALLPGWVLFNPSRRLPVGRKLVDAAFFYALAIVGVWRMWEVLK